MSQVLSRLREVLARAQSSALMERASFGFPNDRIEVKSVHFGDDRTGRVGDVIHPDEYIKKITELYRETWIVAPIKEALSIIETNAELLERVGELTEALNKVNIGRIQTLADASQRERHF